MEDMPYEVLQRAGDILFIPEGFYHATISCGESVAIAGLTPNVSSSLIDPNGFVGLFTAAVSRMHNQTQSRSDAFVERTIELFERALQLHPNNELALFYFGKLLGGRSGRLEQALLHLKRAVCIYHSHFQSKKNQLMSVCVCVCFVVLFR